MASRKHIAVGVLFTVILIALGFTLGLLANQNMSRTSFKPSEKAPPAKPNGNTYHISAPSKGRVNISTSFPMTAIGTRSFVMLDEVKANGIKEGQHLLFYDGKNNLLPIAGKIISVTKGTGEFEKNVALRIQVEDGPDAGADKIAKGEVVLDKMKYAQRLPLSAIVYHNDESAHVWEVIHGDGNTHTTKLRTLPKPPIVSGDFFVLEDGEYISNVYILNPDEKLQEEQSIKTIDVLYMPSDVADPERIAEDKTKWEFKLPEKEAPAGSGSGCSLSACGSTNGVTDFIGKIKNMAREQAQKPKAAP